MKIKKLQELLSSCCSKSSMEIYISIVEKRIKETTDQVLIKKLIEVVKKHNVWNIPFNPGI